ncbi:hypothetical protein ACFL0Y_02975 [Patescibacteria group bacterium]
MTPAGLLNRPGKKERLAIKRQARMRRFNRLRGRLPDFSTRWWIIVGEVLVVLGLLLINLYLLHPFFGREDKINVFSAPIVPILATVTEKIVPFSFGIRIWLLAFLVFFPVSFYYFVREISGRRLAGLLSTLIVTIPASVFLGMRIQLGLLSQDGGHVASLTLIPLVCLLMMRFLRTGNFWTGVLSAAATTFVALTSPIGFLVLVTFMVVITFSEMLLGNGRLKIIRFLVIILMAAGFSSFWYSPKFIFLTLDSDQGQLIRQAFGNLVPLSFFLLPLLGIFGFLLFENRPQLQPIFIGLFLTVTFGLFSLGAGLGHSAPSRFLAAFGLSLSFLLGVLAVSLYDFLRLSSWLRKFKKIGHNRRVIAYGLLAFLLILSLVLIMVNTQGLWELESDLVLGLSSDKKVGLWQIKENISFMEGFLGYAITGVTSFGIYLIKAKLGL